jgi:gag-polypeptide of LTR copia-type
MSYIDGFEESPNKSLYYKQNNNKDGKEEFSDYILPELGARCADRLSEFNRNNKRALGALKSIISVENNERFKDKETAEDLYDSITETFSQTSLELIGRYFNKIIDNNYNSFSNIDEYTSNIQSSNIYLKTLRQNIPKALIAWLILKGLPSSYDNYASRKYKELINNLNNINVNKLIIDLISEEGRINSNINLKANKTSFNNK